MNGATPLELLTAICAGFSLGFAVACILAREYRVPPPPSAFIPPFIVGAILLLGLFTRLL